MRYDEPGLNRQQRMKNVPVELDAMTDAALRYRPKKKQKKLEPKKRRKAR